MTMRTIIYQIPKKKYSEYVEFLGSQKRFIDIISLRLEHHARQEKKNLFYRDTQEMITMHIPIDDKLYPILNEYCIQRGLSKTEVIDKIVSKIEL